MLSLTTLGKTDGKVLSATYIVYSSYQLLVLYQQKNEAEATE